MTMVPLEIAIAAIGLSMVAGVADVVRLPNWAWKKAEEPKIAYVALVGLLPVAGLAMYMVRARPKAMAVIAAGRAASLPFERFGDGAPPMDEEQVAEAPEPIQLVTVPATSLISTPLAPAVTEPKVDEEREESKEQEPEAEPATVGAGTFFSSQSGTATTTATRTLRLPTSLTSRAYHHDSAPACPRAASRRSCPRVGRRTRPGAISSVTGTAPSGPRTWPMPACRSATPFAPDLRWRLSNQAWFEPGGSSRRRPGPRWPGPRSVGAHGLSERLIPAGPGGSGGPPGPRGRPPRAARSCPARPGRRRPAA